MNNINRNMRFNNDHQSVVAGNYEKPKKTSWFLSIFLNFIKILLPIFILLILIFGGFYYTKSGILGGVDYTKDSFYAVFLTNDQVYFGNVESDNDGILTLSSVYYLQFDNQNSQDNINTPSFSLVKLGTEIHGPKEKMYINKDHMLFYEELREDSEVVKSIKQSEK